MLFIREFTVRRHERGILLRNGDFQRFLAPAVYRFFDPHRQLAVERYDLTQVGIAGLNPESEPTPADLAEVSRFVDDHGVTTIYHETLVSPAVAEAVARETGASTAVLDPLEGLAENASGADYFSVMRTNLATLRAGQGCR